MENLYAAVDHHAQALKLAPYGHPTQPNHLNNLGNAYETLFDGLGELEHIFATIDCHMQALAFTPDGHPDKSRCLYNLGKAYWKLFNRLGKLEHIHMAISCIAQSVALTPAGHPDQPLQLHGLGTSHGILFERLGEVEHLHVAVDCMTQAVALTPDGDMEKLGRLGSLGSSYETLFHRIGNPEHLRMAVECKRQAVALSPDNHPDMASHLNSLGSTYLALFDHQGESEYIRLATTCLTQAVGLTAESHPNKSKHLSSLGKAYAKHFDCLGGEPEHIRMAIDCETQATMLSPEGDPSRVPCLTSLGRLYSELFNISHEPEDLVKSKQYLQRAALNPTGYPIDRLRAAVRWAQLSRLDGSDPLEAYTHCMLRLPEVVWLGTSIRRRFEHLASHLLDLVSDAAVAAILANRYDLAVEWLEQGRCLVWSQMLQLRTPLDRLRSAHPELADELHRLSSRLEDTGSFAQDLQTSNMHEGPLQNDTYLHSQLADSRDKLINIIRLKPGFEDFLCSPKSSTIISHVQHGVTVILTVHMSRCDAIIIKPNTHAMDHLYIPDFSHQQAEQLCQQLVTCLKSQGIARGVKKADGPFQASFKNILATLWSNVVKPVLDHLNITRVLPIDDLPHITWCITGPLSFLPVHAAGMYDNPNTVLSNLAISSYTPTISSMGRSRLTPPTFSGILAVGQQSSVRGFSSLPGTKDELDRVEEQFADGRLTRLEEDAATLDAVVKAMASHSWVHFACHGSQDSLDPMNSALHLHDKDLSLAMISRHSAENAQLAFLSACQTAKGDSELPNEAVHLAAGLLMAGYANVIATMWSITDQDAPVVAEEVYRCLLEGGVPDSRKAAKALHRAVKRLQDRIGVNKFVRWVPFIHMGG